MAKTVNSRIGRRMRDRETLFARICGYFERSGFNIVEAKIHTPRDGYALDTFMANVHAALREAERLEEAWMGKGRGTVVRLAGILELLDWSATGSTSPPGHIGRER